MPRLSADTASAEPKVSSRLRFRRRLLLAGLVLVTGYMVVCLLVFLTRPRLKVENFDKIRPGMSRQEVEDLLGGPPGFYRRPRTVTFSQFDRDWQFARLYGWEDSGKAPQTLGKHAQAKIAIAKGVELDPGLADFDTTRLDHVVAQAK